MKRHSTPTRLAVAALAAAAAAVGIPMAAIPTACADQVAYLVNVTVRPGYNFANADHALSYGYSVCDRIAAGVSYPQLITELKSDFHTSDEYQASYLIAQSAQELCPAQIWAVRNSAAGYVGSPA
jgi:hypothetical protein